MREMAYTIAVLCLFAISPARSDIVAVAVNGAIAASGHAFGRCIFTINSCQGYLGNGDLEVFSFGGSTNDNALTFSGSGGASADGGRVTVSATARPTTTVCPEELSIDLQSSAITDAIGAEWGTSFLPNNSEMVTFDLTTESLIHLTIQQTFSEVRAVTEHLS